MEGPNGDYENAAPMWGPTRPRKTFVLCFDGTGNKFSGTDGDSNILKIFGMLDRQDPSQLHYYQPGIGTYVDTKALSHTSWLARLNSKYQKAKDSAVGTSFDEHVMGGYKFLMRYYSSGDDIFFFGFSRGSYIARFLAEMLDCVGLLSAGNEEMARFAWKAFAQWQQRRDGTPEREAKKKKMFEFMKAFRETFSRPVRRIRFLGLFDTVNSVPRFENAWLQRTKFPYTARSSAKVIRHAVGIDERRAKFRLDLISETKENEGARRGRHHEHHYRPDGQTKSNGNLGNRLAVPGSVTGPPQAATGPGPKPDLDSAPDPTPNRYRRTSRVRESHRDRRKSTSPAKSARRSENDLSIVSENSNLSMQMQQNLDNDDIDADEAAEQDTQEIWFAGCHADIGGGWTLSQGERVPLSHGPLVWMVREAQKAGLRLDQEKMLQLKCCDEDSDVFHMNWSGAQRPSESPSIPPLQVTAPSGEIPTLTSLNPQSQDAPRSPFHETLLEAALHGRIHDCLEFNMGLPTFSVIWWKLMEYLPFRRMELLADGSWVSCSWPVPRGEVRDIPDRAWIHSSVIKRMMADENYRPGNLIVGVEGAGIRGVKRAPKEMGIGQWDIFREHGDPVGEVYVKKKVVNGLHWEKGSK